MGRLHRYRTALSRKRRSRGFGVHSPFAFNFVMNVLGERNPYYAYEYLASLRHSIIATKGHRRQMRVMSLKNAKMLFRITNYFNPSKLLQVGTHYGLSTASMMSVSATSHLWLYEPHLEQFPVVAQVMQPFLDDIDCYNDLGVALADYRAAQGTERPFVLVSDLTEPADEAPLRRQLEQWLAGDAVVVLRNLSRNKAMWRLWEHCQACMPHGQSFTNEQIAIIIANPKLPLQHFTLWF